MLLKNKNSFRSQNYDTWVQDTHGLDTPTTQ